MEWAERFLRTMNCNLAVFVESETVKQRLASFCSWPRRVEFYIVPISAWHGMQSPLGAEFWKQQLAIDPERTVHKSPELGAIWYEKMWFVERASRETKFEFDSLIWCDIGILRSRKEQRLAYLFGMDSAPFADNKLHVLQVAPLFNWGCAKPWIPMSGSDISVGGGILGGSRDAWKAARDAYDATMKQLASQGHCVFKDQVVWTNTILESPMLFTLESINTMGDAWMSLLYAWSRIPLDSALLPCFLINLDERKDKWEEIRKETEGLESFMLLLRFPAIRHDEPVEGGTFRNGCTKSHFDILGLKRTVLVLEDDAVLSKDFCAVDWGFLQKQDKNFDLVNLGPSTLHGWHGQQNAALASLPWTMDFLQTRISSTSHAVLYSASLGTHKLATLRQAARDKRLTDPLSCIDYLFGSGVVAPDIIQLVPRQVLARQRAGQSDVSFRRTDYSDSFAVVDKQLKSFYVGIPWVPLKTLQVELQGGFGNQLFQIAAGLCVAAETGRIVSFVKNGGNPHSTTDYFDSVFSKLQATEKTRAVVFQETTASNTRDTLISTLRNTDEPRLTLRGYFQSAKIAASLSEEHLCLPKHDVEIPFAFLHVRGGDYLCAPMHYNHEAAIKYYRKAVRVFAKRQFIVYTDDTAHAERVLGEVGLATSRYFFAPRLSEMESFAQMRACKYGGICANSTFSWWASYFNSSPEALFSLPSQWLFAPTAVHVPELLARANTVVL